MWRWIFCRSLTWKWNKKRRSALRCGGVQVYCKSWRCEGNCGSVNSRTRAGGAWLTQNAFQQLQQCCTIAAWVVGESKAQRTLSQLVQWGILRQEGHAVTADQDNVVSVVRFLTGTKRGTMQCFWDKQVNWTQSSKTKVKEPRWGPSYPVLGRRDPRAFYVWQLTARQTTN